MKLKEGFILRTVAGETVVLPTGGVTNFDMMITLNGTGRFLWEMLGKAYYEAAHVYSPTNTAYLEEALYCFEQVLNLGMTKDYIYTNLYTIYCELGDYGNAGSCAMSYRWAYPDDYTPWALQAMATQNGFSCSLHRDLGGQHRMAVLTRDRNP